MLTTAKWIVAAIAAVAISSAQASAVGQPGPRWRRITAPGAVQTGSLILLAFRRASGMGEGTMERADMLSDFNRLEFLHSQWEMR
jgi:hypothetical protein